MITVTVNNDMWLSRPKLPQRCKLRIFKDRHSGDWVLVFAATPTVESKRKAILNLDWVTAWNTAMAIQDIRNGTHHQN